MNRIYDPPHIDCALSRENKQEKKSSTIIGMSVKKMKGEREGEKKGWWARKTKRKNWLISCSVPFSLSARRQLVSVSSTVSSPTSWTRQMTRMMMRSMMMTTMYWHCGGSGTSGDFDGVTMTIAVSTMVVLSSTAWHVALGDARDDNYHPSWIDVHCVGSPLASHDRSCPMMNPTRLMTSLTRMRTMKRIVSALDYARL